MLMSFLGAGCKLMEGSGLDDLWATAYARGSLPKMMEGKAYTKCLRACLLSDAALHTVLLETHQANDVANANEKASNVCQISTAALLGTEDSTPTDAIMCNVQDSVLRDTHNECTASTSKHHDHEKLGEKSDLNWVDLEELYHNLTNGIIGEMSR